MKKYTIEEENYNTWLLCVNLDNIKSNYDHMKDLGEELLACDNYDFKVILKNEFSYHDVIIFEAVDYMKVRSHIAESV